MNLDSMGNVESIGNIDKRISREYFSELVKSTVAHDFQPVSEYVLTLFGFPVYGYPLPRKIEHKAKKIISDMDLTWTDKQIFGVYVELLSGINDGIKARKADIFRNAKELKPGNVDGPVEEIGKHFRESDVTQNQHRWACGQVPYNIGLKPNSIRCLLELRSMHYDIEFFSGSPELAVQCVVGTNMRLAGFDMRAAGDCVTATEYLFDEYGTFEKLNPMLYEYKQKAVEEKLKRTVGTTKGVNVVLSDEPGDKYMVQSFINPFILTGKATDATDAADAAELPTEISVAMPEANNDMMLIPPVVRKFEAALCFYYFPKDTQKRILESALQFRRICECIEAGTEIEMEWGQKALKDRALDVFGDYTRLAEKLFTTSAGFTGIEEIVRTLEAAQSSDEIKSAAARLLERFREYSPHPDVSERLLKYF